MASKARVSRQRAAADASNQLDVSRKSSRSLLHAAALFPSLLCVCLRTAAASRRRPSKAHQASLTFASTPSAMSGCASSRHR